MRKIECPNCASASFNDIGWNKYICQYCGTVVEADNEVIRVATVNVPIKTCMATFQVDEEMMKMYPDFADSILDDLARKFLPYVRANMEIEEECDPRRMHRLYRAKLRMVGK